MSSSDFNFNIYGNNFAKEERLPGAKGLAQGLAAGMARVGTSGGFHTHAERFRDLGCLHSR